VTDTARPAGRPGRLVASICVLGLALTGLAAWAALHADRNTERRLLETQTRQAAAVLSTAVLTIQQPMVGALDVQASAGPGGRAEAFTDRFARNVGPKAMFTSASVWRRDGGTFTRTASLGTAPGLAGDSAAMQGFLRHAATSKTSVVRRVDVGRRTRIAYGLGDAETGFVVYAERAIPANRRAPVDKDSAYSQLDYAIYLGRTTATSAMTTTDVDPASLPLTGVTARESIPFGDSVLTLVTRPRHHLGSALGQRLPLILLLGGVLLTGIATLVGRKLIGARDRAEKDTATITRLYKRVDALFGEQRDLFVRLQQALLPQANPDLPGIEIATRYVAGGQGIDIGGDWYSVIGVGEERFGFVVGDVSGHGVDAVAEMARARFTLRAYLVDGYSPQQALEKCSRQFDVATDGHIITALVGVANSRTGEVTVANAGHPAPLLVTDGTPEPVCAPAGPPLGVGESTYQPTSFTMPPRSTLICFTDGLVERRGEDIDEGTRRLADTVAPVVAHPLDEVISEVLDAMRSDDASDDVAVLALRRVDA
jgi:serine phosphatase RsbU (regulator of sigma subunit)